MFRIYKWVCTLSFFPGLHIAKIFRGFNPYYFYCCFPGSNFQKLIFSFSQLNPEGMVDQSWQAGTVQ